MNRKKFILSVLGFVICIATPTAGESSTCLAVYKEGGAPAVFQSPKCPRWSLPEHDPRRQATAGRCQSATRQGRRKSSEDRTFCTLDIRIPFPGPNGIRDTSVGIVAVFDGHNGAEASDMASKLLLEYFTLHVYFLLDATFSFLSKISKGMLPNKEEHDYASQMLGWDEKLGEHVLHIGRIKFTLSTIFDGAFHLEILKESLLKAIDDIDAAFCKEASRYSFNSGSTATVILMADSQILAANVGDSKAFLCSETFQSPPEAKATLLRLYRKRRRDGASVRMKDYGNFKLAASDGLPHFSAKELTKDHHPDRVDERSRVESSGGYVLEWGGVSRVNGHLAVSRAIGDLPFKSFGVISVPEVTDWQPLTANDSYLVAASDGVLEKLSSQDVCDLFWELHTDAPLELEYSSSCSYSLADCIVDTALDKGSMDNVAAVVVPFGLQNLPPKHSSEVRLQNYVDEQSELENADSVDKFGRLLVEGKHDTYGCFYLSESLNEKDDYTFWIAKDDQDSTYASPALPDMLDHSYGGPLHLYRDQMMCLHFGRSSGGDRDQCINPDGLASFLGFLESLPAHSVEPNQESFERTTPNTRYILKKRFDRGSYGEVWVAFHWNYLHQSSYSNWREKNKTFQSNTTHHGTEDQTSQRRTAQTDFSSSSPDANLFILKRIMVERGNAVYLSGLREKYFGELFLNASAYLGGTLSVKDSGYPLKESCPYMYNLLRRNESAAPEIEDPWQPEHMFSRRKRQPRVAYEEGLQHIARYIESLESRSNEIWLVFRHEGISLSKLLYTADDMGSSSGSTNDDHIKHVRILHPSKWWHWLKTTEAGQEEMQNLIWQLLMALKSCHDRNITHRDIKPENMIVCFEDQDSGRCLKGSPSRNENYTTKMRIIDFGSAIDEFTIKHLYGAVGPSRDEQTYEYMPPEAFLNATWYQGPTSITTKYDMWSVGVVILELIIGSPNVFQINAITRALLDQHLEGWNEGLKTLAYKLRSFMELCILLPGSSSKHLRTWGSNGKSSGSPASWKCSEEFFSSQIKSRDPLRIGFPNVWALRLVRQLLVWDPEDRFTVDDALRHPYFSQRTTQ
ncbi:uncharacterized protein LOC112518051 isoform X1 [Cynara cardunculus var. scolymus]|uniref:uncharacterized protein LOC112518051 isoform X1 n=1 Tax=Cynara cardunculus var. scolymus TaxID=59895 RepID=UPI000D62FCC5|nr:uncharacterized protein LOC112518051 isoform X1 [Cynara cardunculus var. scolymus]